MTFKLLPPTYDDTKERQVISLPTDGNISAISHPRMPSANYAPNQNDQKKKYENFINKSIYFIFGFVLALVAVSFFPMQDIYKTYSSSLKEFYETDGDECMGLLRDKFSFIPEQLHISLGKAGNREIVFQWATQEPVSHTNVILRPVTKDDQADFVDERLIDGIVYTMLAKEGSRNRTLYGYYAIVDNLVEAKYMYFVETRVPPTRSCNKIRFFSSNVYTFNNPWHSRFVGSSESFPLKVGILGDLGLINGQSTPRIISDIDQDKYHFLIHNGDFGYDLNDHLGTLGDQFMRSIEPIAARVPYQTSVGNHEIADAFAHYTHRFKMTNTESGTQNSLFYSFNMGPVHFVAYSTEFYYFLTYLGPKMMIDQWDWLVKDLTKANSERDKRPWIVVFGHRPMYCSGKDNDDCRRDYNILRKGLPILGTYNLEKLFYEHQVDVVIEAHEHSYERFLPLYNQQVMNGTTDPADPYFNPRGPVHFITGSAGCKERIEKFDKIKSVGSVVRIADYGYTRMYASPSKLKFEQVSDDADGHIVDKFIIKKRKQNNFPLHLDLTI